jgi:hypothetical protein
MLVKTGCEEYDVSETECEYMREMKDSENAEAGFTLKLVVAMVHHHVKQCPQPYIILLHNGKFLGYFPLNL